MKRAFSLIEAMVALALISLVLGLVAEGFNKMNRLNKVSQAASEKIELWSALQRLGSEVSGALTIALPNPHEIRFTRVDPTLNVRYDETRARMPWPWPPATSLAPGILEPNRAPFLVDVAFVWDASTGTISQQMGTVTRTTVAGLHDWKVSFAQDRRLLQIEFVPSAGAQSLTATIYLPMVSP